MYTVRVAFITTYNEFDYAREAIKLRAAVRTEYPAPRGERILIDSDFDWHAAISAVGQRGRRLLVQLYPEGAGDVLSRRPLRRSDP